MREGKKTTAIIKKIKKSIRKVLKNKNFEDREIVIFGCTMWLKTVIDAIRESGYPVRAIIDNNQEKAGGKCLGIDVYLPDVFLADKKNQVYIFICSSYYYEMSKQLDTLGFLKDVDYHIVDYFDKDISFLRSMINVQKGYQSYKKYISKVKGDNPFVFVCPYGGSGDIYMASLFFDKYRALHHIDDYAVLVDGNLAKKTAEMCGMKNVFAITEENKLHILDAWSFFGTENMKVKPLLYWGWRTKRFPNPDTDMDITFLDVMKFDVYNLPAGVQPQIPKVLDGSKEFCCKFFEENNLIPGKTVILAPYAGSFKTDIGINIWQQIADKLIRSGYCVCTNSAGEKEPVLVGTKKVFFPLKYAVSILEYAGAFIGIRSGFCDITSSSKCKFIVLYERALNAVKYEYFSFKRMGLNADAIEYIYDSEHEDDFLQKILSNF